MCLFLGFSGEHSTLEIRVYNQTTNFASPQFHVNFDEKFSIIQNDTRPGGDTTIESIFNYLFESCRKYFGKETIVLYGATAAICRRQKLLMKFQN